jgi:hypothetical protein
VQKSILLQAIQKEIQRHDLSYFGTPMRRLLNQAANAAVKVKGSIFEIVYRRSVPRLGHNQGIGAIAHR